MKKKKKSFLLFRNDDIHEIYIFGTCIIYISIGSNLHMPMIINAVEMVAIDFSQDK